MSGVFWLMCLVASLASWQGCQNASPPSPVTTPNAAQVESSAAQHGEACQTTPNREMLHANASVPDSSISNASSDALPHTNRNAKTDGMVFINGGTFQMRTNNGMPYEAPAHEVTVKSFYMDKTEVTVAEFAGFVEATGYVTEAGWGSAGREFSTCVRARGRAAIGRCGERPMARVR